MIAFSKIKPGMILYDVRKAKGFSRHKWDTWQVHVQEVNQQDRTALVSWNFNPPEWMSADRISKYRKSRPKQ